MKITRFTLTVLLSCFVLLPVTVVANSHGNKSPFDLKLGYSRYTTGRQINNKREHRGNYRLEMNYSINKLFSTGIYVGLGTNNGIAYGDTKNYIIPNYGVSANFHPLPLITDAYKNSRMDFYLHAKFGGQYVPTPNHYSTHGHYNEYGVGVGLAYYIWQHIGVFCDYSFGKFHLSPSSFVKDNHNLRLGLDINF